jgi:hypothetical protein
MKQGAELWEEYCGFISQSFHEQMSVNEKKRGHFFDAWKQTKAAEYFCPGGAEKFEDIPLTTYEDYPVLREFGRKVEQLSETIPQEEGEDLWDYYVRLGGQASSIVDGWLVDDFGMCCKTSGTSGDSKWLVHGKSFVEVGFQNIMSFFMVACSEAWGETRLRKEYNLINIAGPSPYLSNMVTKCAVNNGISMVPPVEIAEKTADMRKKIMLAMKMVEKGERIDMGGGIASAFHLACRYFTDRDRLYKDFYQSMNFSIPKIVFFFMWIYQSLFGKKYKTAGEILTLKGLATGGFDTEIYADYLKEQFGIDPLNVYGATETGFIMFGPPDRRRLLMPILNSGYFEFLTSDDEVKKIDELEKDTVYELVFTPYASVVVRMTMGDLFKVADIRDDGLPLFSFESRKKDRLDIRNAFLLTEALAARVLVKAGLPPTDKWAFVKEMEPEEHLCLLMEREWDYSEEEASRRVFEAIREIEPYFRDFGVKDAQKIIRVEYLQKGAFMRYIMLRAQEGAELGQIKPLKLITPQNREIAEVLRRV